MDRRRLLYEPLLIECSRDAKENYEPIAKLITERNEYPMMSHVPPRIQELCYEAACKDGDLTVVDVSPWTADSKKEWKHELSHIVDVIWHNPRAQTCFINAYGMDDTVLEHLSDIPCHTFYIRIDRPSHTWWVVLQALARSPTARNIRIKAESVHFLRAADAFASMKPLDSLIVEAGVHSCAMDLGALLPERLRMNLPDLAVGPCAVIMAPMPNLRYLTVAGRQPDAVYEHIARWLADPRCQLQAITLSQQYAIAVIVQALDSNTSLERLYVTCSRDDPGEYADEQNASHRYVLDMTRRSKNRNLLECYSSNRWETCPVPLPTLNRVRHYIWQFAAPMAACLRVDPTLGHAFPDLYMSQIRNFIGTALWPRTQHRLAWPVFLNKAMHVVHRFGH